MKKLNLFLVILLFNFPCPAQNFEWALTEDYPGVCGGLHALNDNRGNTFIAGQYDYSTPMQPEVVGGFVSMYSAEGILLWNITEQITQITCAIDPNNVLYVAAGDSLGFFLKKYDVNGVILFSKYFGLRKNNSCPVMIRGIAFDNEENYYVGGFFRDTLSLGNSTFYNDQSENRIFIAKYSSSNQLIWAKAATSGHLLTHTGMCTDVNNNVYMYGDYLGVLSISGNTMQSTGFNAFVLKFDKNGANTLSFNIDGSGQEFITSAKSDVLGNLYVLGYYDKPLTIGSDHLTTANSTDGNIFISKIDLGGNLLRSIQIGGALGDVPGGLVIDSEMNLFISGGFIQSIQLGDTAFTGNAGNYNPFLAKISPGLEVIGGLIAESGLSSEGYAADLVFNSAGDLFTTGHIKGSVRFGTHTLISGEATAFLAKVNKSEITDLENLGKSFLSSFEIYPNPSNARVNLRFNISIAKDLEISVYNFKGQMIGTEYLPNVNGRIVREFDLSKLPKGNYYIQLSTEGQKVTKKQVLN